jgi:hypothetical protein
MGQQLKKLFFDKKLTDSGKGVIATWRTNPWKIFGVLFSLGILGIIVYGFLFSGNPNNFFGNVVFYAIVIVIAIASIYILASSALKFRKLIAGFLIAFIIIFVFYWVLGLVFTYTGLLNNWHYGGWSLIIVLVTLAGIGAKRIDGNLDRADIFYGFLVFLVLCGINIPIANNMGFLANVDNLIGKILGLVPWKL